MSKDPATANTPTSSSDLLIYQAPDGKIKIDVRLEGETVWLSQDHMTQLFGKSKQTISEHIRNIFDEAELEEQSGYPEIPDNHPARCNGRQNPVERGHTAC